MPTNELSSTVGVASTRWEKLMNQPAIYSNEWFAELSETRELECKLANGRDGKGAIPEDFWRSYSAFANSHGGLVLLGVEEKPIGSFSVVGVPNAQKLVTDLFNNLNNTQKISANLLSDDDVKIVDIGSHQIIEINIPQAPRTQKPIHLTSNPMNGNTYRRLHDGDRRCDDETVRRMLAERVEDERDSRILKRFDWNDIDTESFRIYRQMLRDAKPGHPWLDLDDFELLKRLRGWRKDPETGEEGLTLAGLLMFGKWESIQEGAPHYFVDYQERPEAKTELRWVDRLVPDGTWSGNIFDFYRIVYRKLTDPQTLKVPFKLATGQRRDDTPVHEAIREALVNTIVHADYSGRLPVLVVKRPDMFGFRNPGDMRIPIEQALKGGETDCRNRILHQMFLMIGLGERAGSGIPKIYSGWSWRHWRKPALYEKDEPPQTLLELRMLELLPEGIIERLQQLYGDKFNRLSELERLILATAATEQVTNHSRICEISSKHTRDITLALQSLIRKSFLESTGHGKGAVYHLPGQSLPTPEQVFGDLFMDSSEHLSESSEHLSESSEHSDESSEHIAGSIMVTFPAIQPNEQQTELHAKGNTYDEYGRLLTEELKYPVIYDLNKLAPEFRAQLEEIAKAPRIKPKLDKALIREVIINLCSNQYITRNCLAELVNRDPDALRQQYVKTMVNEHVLDYAFPQAPTHLHQAYIAVNPKNDG